MENSLKDAIVSENKPEVSVITAVYNRELYLERAIKSLLEQTLTSWELIAVDDGSSDNSFSILKDYQKKYKNITIISQKHRKNAISKNTGIEFSRGKYITFLDSDDEYLSEHLTSRYNYMLNNPTIDLVHGGFRIIGNAFVTDKNDHRNLIPLYECIIGGTIFGKRKVFETLGGFVDIKYGEDSDFIERAVKIFNVKKVDYPTYIYHRDTPDSITNKIVRQ